MPKPVTVSVDVPQPRQQVWEHLDVLANHERWTDHLLKDWRLSGPPTGVGARVRVTATALGVTDTVDIEVTEADPPRRSVERNRARKAGRVAEGTYVLDELPDGGTRVRFTYAWIQAPLADRALGPIVRAYVRRANTTAMARLREDLAARRPPAP